MCPCDLPERLDLLAPVAAWSHHANLDALRLRRSWPRGSDRLLLEYETPCGMTVAGQWHADRSRLDDVANQTRRACDRPSDVVVVDHSQLGVLLQQRGADRRLTTLAGVVDQPGATLLVHRPERRAVVRLGRDRYLKVLPSARMDDVLTAWRAADSLRRTPFAVPEILDVDAEQGLLQFRAVPGRPLMDLESDLTTALREVGRCLRWLHEMGRMQTRRHDADDEWRVVERWLAHTAASPPAIHTLFGDRPALVQTGLSSDSATTGFVHRDLHDKQILVDPTGRLSLLDFDTCAAGEVALDLGNLIAHFELRALQQPTAAWSVPQLTDALLDGYDASQNVRARIPAYLDATRLRLACVYAFRPAWRHLCPLLIERVGTSIDDVPWTDRPTPTEPFTLSERAKP